MSNSDDEFDFSPTIKWGVSDEELLDELERVAEKLGRVPTGREVEKQSEYSESMYRTRFGSFNTALEKAGYEPHKQYSVSKDELIEELQSLADRLGKVPTKDEMKQHGAFSQGPYFNKFDSWNDALEEAGLETNLEHIKRDVSEEDITKDIQRVARVVEEPPPTMEQYREHGVFPLSVPMYHLGRWNVALEEAGFEPNMDSGPAVTKEELTADLKSVAAEIGGVPRMQDVKETGTFSPGTYSRRFGDWKNALRKAGFDVPKQTGREKDRLKLMSGDLKARRRRIQKRDEDQCRVCGETVGPGTAETHHIEPREYFYRNGALVENIMNKSQNLITLCSGCHEHAEGWYQDCSPGTFERKVRRNIIPGLGNSLLESILNE